MTLRAPALCLPVVLLTTAAWAQDHDWVERYRPTADKLIDAALSDTEGYDRLAYLCYRIGNRLS